jgi:hypothetical protein
MHRFEIFGILQRNEGFAASYYRPQVNQTRVIVIPNDLENTMRNHVS